MPYLRTYFDEVATIAQSLDIGQIEEMVNYLARLKTRHKRLFIFGIGGSAANASHAVNDFRKLCGINAMTPTDNASELTARINDEGWDTCFAEWLRAHDLSVLDVVLVLSVGGGSVEKGVSMPIVKALEYARAIASPILGIVGRDGGYTKRMADACVVVPTVSPERVTPHAEAFQAVIWHAIVTHPRLQERTAKWESVV
jgi:D-sedoheptulose 7-phosphate isomerase